MNITRHQLKILIENFLHEQESSGEKRKDTTPSEVSVKDSKGLEHLIRFNQEKPGVYQLYINDQHYNPQGIDAAKKLNNAFLAISALVLSQYSDKEKIARKMIAIIKSVDDNLSKKSDASVTQIVLNKQRGGRLPYSLTDELLNRDKI